MLENFTAHKGAITTTARLNVRLGAPGTHAAVAMKVEPGVKLRVHGVGAGQDVMGNRTWFAGDANTYFWSGGCSAFVPEMTPSPAGTTTSAVSVNRRPDGTILPLNDAGLKTVFGAFNYKEANGGRIVIDQHWVKNNITRLKTPTLDHLGVNGIDVHVKSVDAFNAAFGEIEKAGLSHLFLTYAGTWVPRHKGWDPGRGLSSHSWGVAIDFNVAWNGYGKTPAALGTHGSLREIVPYFEAQGFAWGGYFSPPYEDGMHFELARTDL
jgi:hypothetical protein